EVIEANDRSVEEQLASVRFAVPGEPPAPTALGVLACGVDPREFLPCAYVQFLRLEGTELTDPIKDQKEIDGPLPELVRGLEETFRAHISSASNAGTASVEVRAPDYPLEALRQVSRNALMHRTYEGTNAPVRIMWFSDRVEILSPGGPFGQVTPENFGTPGATDYRNPNVAEAMKNLGYVQRFGMGIPIALKEMLKNGNPAPEFDARQAHVLATLRRRE
ncbi:MAG: ATP-binding protein, partial [Planctomycetota bacterium]